MTGADLSIRLFSRAAFVIGLLFAIPGTILVSLGLLMMIHGEGRFADAAPWRLLMLLAGFIALIPGAVSILVSRRSRKAEESVSAIRGN